MNQFASILGQNIVVLTAGQDRMLGFDMALITGVGFNILNIMVLAYVLWRVLYGPVKKFLADRAARVQAQLDDADKMFKDAESFKSEYTSKLDGIDAERANIMDSVKKRALTDEAAIIKKANEQAEALKNRAYDDIEREKEKAQDEMKRQILELSAILTQRYISEMIDSDHQNKLLDDIIEEMRVAQWQN
ncbi:MAG: F0F1 ATP synthase subunit B [Defluviitaleaceae bacterium]|nr:F0F1 ATP synthase subunit B [Defluviitaleaceae bacterium]